jgi:hypothetical protein
MAEPSQSRISIGKTAHQARSHGRADLGTDYHGKEGVSGSSPELGFSKRPANRHLVSRSSTQVATNVKTAVWKRYGSLPVCRRFLARPPERLSA